jgi:hypothetical protein
MRKFILFCSAGFQPASRTAGSKMCTQQGARCVYKQGARCVHSREQDVYTSREQDVYTSREQDAPTTQPTVYTAYPCKQQGARCSHYEPNANFWRNKCVYL